MTPLSRRTLSVALLVSAPFVGAFGCRTTSAIHPGELRRLDGYQAGVESASPPQQLQTLSGESVAFTADSNLYLGLSESEVGGQFASIRVRDATFEGETARGDKIQVPLERIREARVDNGSPLRTGGAIAGGVVVAALLLGAFLVLRGPQSEGVPGRALRLGGRAAVASPATTWAWSADRAAPDVASLSTEVRAALGAAWLASARGEHASVPAFARLSLTLVALGAPARLVERIHHAALDEVEHARLSFALASAYLGAPVSAGPLLELHSARAVTATTIWELAEESLVEGCLLEGTAAAVAGAALARATDPAARGALATIARDEAAHVALSWDIVAWCCDQSGPALVEHLIALAARPREVRAPFDVPRPLAADLAAHGCLGGDVWRAEHERTRRAVLERLRAGVGDGVPSARVRSA